MQAPTPGTLRAVAPLGDTRYPATLLNIDAPPLILYLLGPARFLAEEAPPLNTEQCVAMVGSRNPTAQGQTTAMEFARSLRASGLSIVSGLALGVDAAAHEGALANASDNDTTPATIAVVGTGLDRVYPRRNLGLAHRIAAYGLIISEYPLGTPPLAGNFPKRNRIIAGLSQGTLVIEAAPASGSLITARLAAEQGREVFAVPGSIYIPQSRGCHALIRQGAKLVESAQDILEELRLPTFIPKLKPISTSTSTSKSTNSTVAVKTCHVTEALGLGIAETPLLAALALAPVGLDALVARTGMETSTLLVQLLELELEGAVARLPGGLFQRVAQA